MAVTGSQGYKLQPRRMRRPSVQLTDQLSARADVLDQHFFTSMDEPIMAHLTRIPSVQTGLL